MAHEVALLSPEKTIITYRLAGVGARIMAKLLDIAIIIVTLIGITTIIALIGAMSGYYGEGIFTALGLILMFAFPLLYCILFEGLWNGQTVGKKALGLRVRTIDGTPIRFGAAVGRNLMLMADFLPVLGFAGIVAIFTNPRGQRIGDLLAGTIVVYERSRPVTFTVAPHAVNVHPFEDSVGDLRGMTMEEYLALRRLCDRFPELSIAIQKKMVDEVWLPIARNRKIPLPAHVHPIYIAEAVVMRFGRTHGLL